MTGVWFKKQPIGKNTIDAIMTKMKENSPLKDDCPNKKLTNQISRKMVVKKVKGFAVPNKNITSHASEKGLGDYDSDENEQQMISNIFW